MDRKEAILRIKDHMEHHGIGKYPHLKLKEALDMAIAALSQPNEPLTWEELEKLKNSPVYIEVIGVNSYWALVRDINDCGVWLMTVDDIDDYGSHRLYGKTWIAYRRPPEEEI